MAEILKGAPVAAKLCEDAADISQKLRSDGVVPTLAIVRIGEREGDLSYERGATKRCAAAGVEIKSVAFDEDVPCDGFFKKFKEVCDDETVHGILLMRPLPDRIDTERARRMIPPTKDIDGCTDLSLAGVFTGSGEGFAPCTAEAVTALLDYYKIDCDGANIAVVGRSLVIGRPVAMLLMRRNATVTICHTHTRQLARICSRADIVIACAGVCEMLGADCFSAGQTIVDVGVNFSEQKQKLCGDVNFDAAAPVVGAITPVPGGVGAVTSAVAALHVAQAAQMWYNRRRNSI